MGKVWWLPEGGRGAGPGPMVAEKLEMVLSTYHCAIYYIFPVFQYKYKYIVYFSLVFIFVPFALGTREVAETRPLRSIMEIAHS